MVIAMAWLPLAAHGMGCVPDGFYTSDENTAETVEDAKDYCDSFIACAGMTYGLNTDEEEEHDWTVYFHSFLPPLLCNNSKDDWITERSHKSFVFHPGKVNNSSLLELDNLNDLSNMSLEQVMETCKNHSDCVAFSYPVHASHLIGFDEIIFASSVQDLDYNDDDWHTFVVNDEERAAKANADVLIYDQDLKEKPYSTCCNEASVDDLPTVEQVQTMDSLPRISCDITAADFLAQYEFARKPVMLVGCDEQWPAKTEWTMEKLTERFGNDTETTWRTKTLETPQDWEDITWMEMVNKQEEGLTPYIFDPLDESGKASIEDDYKWPEPFVGKDLYPEDFPPGFGNRHWFCLGARGSGTIPHSDPFGSDAWNT